MKSTNILKCLTILGLIGSVGNVTVKAEELTESQKVTTENETLTEEKEENTIIETPTEEPPVSGNENTTYTDFDVLENLKDGDKITIDLKENVTKNIVIPANSNVTINLNGHTITNKEGNTITNKGHLIINGNGTVNADGHDPTALYNEVGATVTLNGGTYTRQSMGYYYNIENQGTMIINDGVSVVREEEDTIQYLILNGWASTESGEQVPAKLIINGGDFDGGRGTIFNGGWGDLVIKDGTFENAKESAVVNFNVATINDGTFSSGMNTVQNIKTEDASTKGKLSINGGTFTSSGKSDITSDNSEEFSTIYNAEGATAELNGGTYTKDESDNDFAIIENYGIMTIKDGVNVFQEDNDYTLITNGWNDQSLPEKESPAILTIEGGTFSGGGYTIGNAVCGKLTINGGTFENAKESAIVNYNIATINGGTFSAKISAILNMKVNEQSTKGELTITGGTFSLESEDETDKKNIIRNEADGEITITGGQFNGKFDPSFIAPGYKLNADGTVSTIQPPHRPSTPSSKPKNVSAETIDGDKVKVKEVSVYKDLENALFAKKSTVTAIEVGEAEDDVIVTYKAGREYKNTVLYVVGYDEETKKAVLLDTVETDSKGTVEFVTQGDREITLVSVIKGWMQDEKGTWYFFDYATGEQRKNGWLAEGADWYYLDATGAMKTNAWVWRDSHSAYYVNAEGKMIYGPTYISGYYVNEKGLWIR